MNSQLLFLHALTPLHAGTGQGVGVIDLPIAREKATGIPFLPGSSLKGALKPLSQSPAKNAVFGQEGDEGTGAAQFADARLLCLPARSLHGTFAWVSSPYLLERLGADFELAKLGRCPSIPQPAANEALTTGDKLKVSWQGNDLVVLEDLDLKFQSSPAVIAWADHLKTKIFPRPEDQNTAARFAAHFCIVPDDVCSFLLQSATEVQARIKLQDDTKTVQKGGLWYEENLPAETILTSVLTAMPLPVHGGLSAVQVLQAALSVRVAQFGGKAGVGRGLCRLSVFPEVMAQ